MARWREVYCLYGYEIRSALRERTIVVNSIVIPMVLYPAILWIAFTGLEFIRGQTADQVSRVGFSGLTVTHQDLERSMRRAPRIEILAATDLETAERSISSGTLDAFVRFDPAPASGLPDNVRARILFDGSRERSETARTRLREALRIYRERRLRDEAFARGVTSAAWAGFALDDRNVASGAQMGQSILGTLVPLFFVIEIFSHLARPLSLALRLFGNMAGGHILLAVIFLLMGLDGLIGWALSGSVVGAVVGGIGGAVTIVFTVGFLYPLKILVAFLQAFIFVMLTMLYISGATEEAEHHSEHH